MKKVKEMILLGRASVQNWVFGKMKGDSKLLVEILLIAIVAGLIVLYRSNITDSFNTLFTNIKNSFDSVIS